MAFPLLGLCAFRYSSETSINYKAENYRGVNEKRMQHLLKLVVAVLACALFSCTTTGRVVDGSGKVFSEYFENISYLIENKIKVHAIETLGKERYPKGHLLSQEDKRYLNSPDTIETVFEIYVTNNSEKEIRVVLDNYKSRGSRGSFEGEVLSIAAGKWSKSSKKISVSSIYGPDSVNYNLSLIIDGTEDKIEGKLRRTPLNEVQR